MENNIILLMGALGALVFLTNVVVEVLKRVLPDKIPTDILVFIVSIILSEGALLGYNTLTPRPHVWFEYLAMVIVGFIVAYIAMYSWTKLVELWNRSKKPE